MRRLLAILGLVAGLAGAPARGHGPGAEVPYAEARPASGPIVIDGRLDEAAWAAAPAYDGLVERTPRLRAQPPVDTRFRVVYDREALYFGVLCEDTGPEAVRARTYARDSFDIFADDALSLKLDTAHDHRTTLGFVLSPSGARLDYRGVNESEFRVEHDAVWEGAAAVHAHGWSAEFRIPLSELGLSPWDPPERIGFNVTRDHSRRNATYDWSLTPPPFSPVAASLYGHLGGLDGLRELVEGELGAGGAGALAGGHVHPWALAGFRREPEGDAGRLETAPQLDAGADAELRFRRGFRLQLTANTDFAEVDLDDQVINLGRFSLFVPEKREFFLRDAEVFAFGRSGASQLFQSRRIGLDRGREVGIAGGLKAVGPVGRHLRVGALSVVTRPRDDLPWSAHTVLRGLGELAGGSNLGWMVTQRHSLEDAGDYNLALGLDGAFRGGGSPLLAEAFAVLTADGPRAGAATADIAGRPPEGDAPGRVGGAAALDVRWRGELWRPRLGWGWFSEDLRADLGFFQRVGVHQGVAALAVEPRFERLGVERLTVEARGELVLGEADLRALDRLAVLEATLDWERGTSATLALQAGRETVEEAFSPGPGVEVPAGDYRARSVSGSLATPSTASAGLTLGGGLADFFGGDVLQGSAGGWLWPGTWLRFEASADVRRARFRDDPRPDFTTVALNARAAVGLTPDLNLSLAGQWNRLDALVRAQLRLRWTWRAGSDLFLIYQADVDDDLARSRFHSLLAKLTVRVP